MGHTSLRFSPPYQVSRPISVQRVVEAGSALLPLLTRPQSQPICDWGFTNCGATEINGFMLKNRGMTNRSWSIPSASKQNWNRKLTSRHGFCAKRYIRTYGCEARSNIKLVRTGLQRRACSTDYAGQPHSKTLSFALLLKAPSRRRIDPLQRLPNLPRLHRSHQPRHFPPPIQHHQRRPQLHPVRPPQPPSPRIRDLQVPHPRMRSQRGSNQRLRPPAMPASRPAELEQRRPGKGINLGARRLGFCVGLVHRNEVCPARSNCTTGSPMRGKLRSSSIIRRSGPSPC